MITTEQFERGLRLDQYIATITQNKENFRANFIKATEIFTADDLAFFRNLPHKVHVAVLTEDNSLDAVRDVPIIGRLSVEVGKLALRLFRPGTHADAARELLATLPATLPGDHPHTFPIVAFFDDTMNLLGVSAGVPQEITAEINRRRTVWAESHPEIADARETLDRMTPITRTRMTQALYALTPEQRIAWGRTSMAVWRHILSPMRKPAPVDTTKHD